MVGICQPKKKKGGDLADGKAFGSGVESDESVMAGFATDDDADYKPFLGDDKMDEAYGDDFPAPYGREGRCSP